MFGGGADPGRLVTANRRRRQFGIHLRIGTKAASANRAVRHGLHIHHRSEVEIDAQGAER
jgi:hypothetical protein